MVPSPNNVTVKFICSYGGKILPRHTDGKLRYHGGHTRVLSFHRSVPFSEVMVKLADMCGSAVVLRCQLPTEDLDALVSITSDEDLANLIEEYDRVSTAAEAEPLKIRAFLYPPKSAARKATVSPPSPSASPSDPSSSSSSLSSSYSSSSPRSAGPAKPPLPPSPPKVAAKIACHGCYVHRNPSHIYLIQNGNHWQ